MAAVLAAGDLALLPQDGSTSRALLRKSMHVGVYAVLGFAVAWAAALPSPGPWKRVAIAVLVAAAVGVLDEWRQTRVPWRNGHISDVVLDSVGAALGVFVHATTRRRRCWSGLLQRQ
jgi:VanZ family protein